MIDRSNLPELLTPAEVGALFRVDPETVTRWAKTRRLSSIRTLGGHRRYLRDEILGLIEITHADAKATPPSPKPVPAAVEEDDVYARNNRGGR